MKTSRTLMVPAVSIILVLAFLVSFSPAYIQGDIDGDEKVSLSDAILVMRFLTKMRMSSTFKNDARVGSDPRIGIDEVIYVLQAVSEIRTPNVSPKASFTPTPKSGDAPLTVTLDASSSSDSDGTVVGYTWDFGDGESGSGASVSHQYNIPGTYRCVLTVTDEGGARDATSTWIVVTGQTQIPPDPSEIAPKLDQTVSTAMVSATSFLYTGSNCIQTGMAPDTIEPARVAVLRGKVMNRSRDPLPGVRITILNHPEFGQTLSRDDGMFDLALNGGGHLTVQYEKAGYFPAQRKEEVPWQDYVWLPDLVMIQPDDRVSTIDLVAPSVQVARGSVITEDDGTTRQATLLFPQGSSAKLVMPDGSTQPISTLNVRATEYTVGEDGPKAMPAELPPSSGYTYAVELSADEALSAGAVDVLFDEPVYFYLEDFIGFPVGSAVPTGYYDKRKGEWVASDNGRVLKIVDIADDQAQIDTDGDYDFDTDDENVLTSLGVTADERRQLAQLYPSGNQQVWRVPIRHFSPWDCNWPYGPPDDAEPPMQPEPVGDGDPEDNSCKETGNSVIECQNQVLSEEIPIVGTPFKLSYSSYRAAGRKAANVLTIPLTGDTLSPSVLKVHLEIRVAGRVFTEVFSPETNLTYTFEWDGVDAYGRKVQGEHPVKVKAGYSYEAVYYPVSAELERSFARVWGSSGSGGAGSASGMRAAQKMILWRHWEGRIGVSEAKAMNLGGWTLDVHYTYDPQGEVLYGGEGGRRSASTLGKTIIRTVAGNGESCSSGDPCGDGAPAVDAQLSHPLGMALAQDGSLYIADKYDNRIRRVGTDGVITTVAGTGEYGFSGDGGPATEAMLAQPTDVAIGFDGSLYIADYYNFRLRRVDGEGMITTVAGTGVYGSTGDGGPAIEAQIAGPSFVTVSPDGGIYLSDDNRIRRIDNDGVITTVAGTGVSGYSGDGGLATQARVWGPGNIALAPDGSFYFADTLNNRIRRVGTDGMITTVAGTGSSGFNGDGIRATQAWLKYPSCVALSPAGSLYIADNLNYRVRKVTPDGIITTVAGSGSWSLSDEGDGGPATQAKIADPTGIAIAPDGSLSITSTYGKRVRRVSNSMPAFSGAEMVIASEDGTELFQFDPVGRHLATVNALTGAVLYKFSYNREGHLIAVEDGYGRITFIERNGNGDPVAILGHYGQRTTFVLNGDGYLAGITNPAGETHSFTYHGEAGLLATHTNLGGSLSQYTYDALGHLVRSDDPAGGFKVLSRTKLGNAYEVAVRTAEDRTTTYRVETLPAGEKRRTTTFPCGCQNEALTRTDGSRTITFSDGAVITEVLGPDPRWGMQAPLQTSLSIRLPEGTTSTQTRTRTVVLDDPQDLMSLISQTDTMTINGRVYISTYDAASQTTTMTSPEGRQITEQIDAQGKLLQKQTAALYPLKMAYDADGRLLTATEGIGAETRTINASYNSQGYLSNFSDSLGRTEQYAYDAAGRLTQKLLPAGAGIGFAYDLQGNLISITPPGQPSHTFAHTAAGKIAAYPPPHIGTGSTTIEHTYNADHQMTQINWPDEKALEFGYDAAGRKASMTIPRGTYTYGYDGTTGMLTTMASPDGGILSLVYDGALMRGMTWSGTVAGSIALTRDNQFNITSHSVNGGATVLFEYDNDGLLTKAGELSISRDAQTGFVTGSELGVVTEAMSYNNFGELSRYAVTQGAGTLYDARYSYDPVGRINRYVENIGGVTETYDYTYDVAGRLAEVHKNGERVASYEYDLNGNRLTAVDGVGYAEGEYDAQDRLLSYGDRSYTYGAGGELSSKTEGSSMTTGYSYDELGNLMSVTLPSSRVVEYVVDGRNRRIGKKVNGTLVQGFLYKDLLNPIAELNGSNDVVSRFVYGTKPNVPDYMEKNGVVYRIISDHLGSVRLVVNAEDGSVIQRIDYDAFGNVLNDTFEGFQPFGFAGGLYDTHTRLVRFGVRDYDSVIGRWTTRDPIGFASESVNLYGYVGNDPVNLVDPTGRYFWWIALGTAGLFATGFEVSRDFRDIRDLFNYLKDKLEPQVIDLSDVTEVPEPKASRFAPDRPRAYGFGGDPLPPIECN